MRPRKSVTMQIWVETPRATSPRGGIEQHWAIAQVKSKIKAQMDISHQKQLSFSCKHLKDSQTLADYNIQHG